MKYFNLAVFILITFALVCVPATADLTMTFEEFVGYDEEPLSTFYQGVTFIGSTTGSEWVARDGTSNNYNVSAWDCVNEVDTGMTWGSGEYWTCEIVGTTTALDSTGDDGIISFDSEDATYVELRYCSGHELFLLAYNSSDVLLDDDSAPANRRYSEANAFGPGVLRVDAPAGESISYVVVHDGGNYWVIDSVSTDASGISGTLTPDVSINCQSPALTLPGWGQFRVDVVNVTDNPIEVTGGVYVTLCNGTEFGPTREGSMILGIGESDFIEWTRPVNPLLATCNCDLIWTVRAQDDVSGQIVTDSCTVTTVCPE